MTQWLPALPPALFLAFLFDAAQRVGRRPGLDWPRRTALLAAAVLWGMATAALAEGLSAFRLLTHGWAVAAWSVLAMAAAALPVGLRRGRPPAPVDWRGLWPTGESKAFGGLALGALAAVFVATFVTAVVAPPDNWDSMTYHLARVAHWAQNRSLAHYPTHNVRQLYMAPGAELIILNLQLLVGADRLVNLPQWGALIGSAAAASLLAMRLGAGWRGQLAAAVVAATIPHGVASASGAQNDLVAAFWLLAAATLTWEYRRRPHWANAAAAGGAFGLGVLTKSTFFPYGLPFGLLLAAAAWQARGRRAWRPLLTAGLIAAALNAPWTIRNYAVFGHPLVDRQERGSYQNETHAPAALASVALRSAAMHLATPSEPINRAVYRAVAAVHRALGLELDDPRTTYLGTAFRPPEFSLHEDRATAPLHLLLALGCGAAALGARRARAKRETAIFAALLFASGATYLALLKWQPWPSKHLPWLVCSAPLVAVVLERWRPWIAGVAALTLAAAATPYLVMNQTRPLLGERSIFRTPRLEQYFATAPYLLPPYVGLARYAIAHRCADVGLRWSKDTPEYQLWALLAAGGRPFRLEHVEVRNRSAAAADGAPGYASFRPCVTFSALEGVRRFEAAAADGSEAIIFSQDPL